MTNQHGVLTARRLMLVLVPLMIFSAAIVANGEDALQALRLKATNGDALTQFALGRMYDKGKGVPEDKSEAAKWYSMAADQGNANAQYNIGQMYRLGKGIPENYAEAAKWLLKAAEQGHAEAQYNIGEMYRLGKEVDGDEDMAAKWMSKAAEQGHAEAQERLALMCSAGRGVPEDAVEAYKWWILASAARTSTGASSELRAIEKALDSVNESMKKVLAKNMTRKEIEEAQELARDWKPTKNDTDVAK